MIEKVYIQERGMGRMEPEMRDLYAEFQARGHPVQLFIEKQIMRRQLTLSKNTLVAGDIPVVINALKQLGVTPSLPNDYPQCLRPYLRRRVWQSNVAAVRNLILSRDFKPFFAKPKDRLKRFTGRVFESIDDLMFIANLSGSLGLFCSEVVGWVTEYRVFVISGKIAGIKHYQGEETVVLDHRVVGEAVSTFEQSGEAHVAYAIDFGVLEDGATALIEVNDGFSIGSYGLDRAIYADFTVARWQELIEGPSKRC
jgi:ATP-grasp domain-containing protein